MTVFDTKKNKSICVLPWIHEFKSIDGKIAPCCLGENLRSHETMDDVRKQMLDGLKPRVCDGCYIKEEQSGWSPRINETISWINKFGEPDVDRPSLQYADIRFDPTCNLKCKFCGPRYSTLWQKERNIKVEVNQDNRIYLSGINKHNLKKVYLAGGEPTYIKEYLFFLQELYDVNPNCEVMINTNLKKLNAQWKDMIKKFKNLTVICSCDATGTLGTYVRYPLSWREFEENVQWASENANFFQFNLVASNLTSHKLFETCTWMKKYSRNINLMILEQPDCFNEGAVPLNQRQVYMANIEKLMKFPVSVHYAGNFRSKVKHLLKKYNTTAFDEKQRVALKQELEVQDTRRTVQLKEVDQFLHDWIYG